MRGEKELDCCLTHRKRLIEGKAALPEYGSTGGTSTADGPCRFGSNIYVYDQTDMTMTDVVSVPGLVGLLSRAIHAQGEW